MSLTVEKELCIKVLYTNKEGDTEGVLYDYEFPEIATTHGIGSNGINKFTVYLEDIPKLIEALQEAGKYYKACD